MPRLTDFQRLALAATALLALAGPAAAGDRATVRGRVEAIDLPTRTVKVQTAGGEDLALRADDRSELTAEGKKATLEELRLGQRVRATYEKDGSLNRLVSLRTAVPAEADLGRDVKEALKSAKDYTFAQKDKYEERLRSVLDDVDDRLDDLNAKAKDARGEAKAGLEKRVRELEKARTELGKRLDKAKPAVKDAWDDLKAGVGAAADDLGRALDELRAPAKKQ